MFTLILQSCSKELLQNTFHIDVTFTSSKVYTNIAFCVGNRKSQELISEEQKALFSSSLQYHGMVHMLKSHLLDDPNG